MNREQTERRKAFIINLLYYIALIGVIWVVFKYVISWFLPFIIGFGIATLFEPATKTLVKRIKIGHKTVTVIVLLLGYAVLISLLTLLMIQIIAMLRNLFTLLPTYFNEQVLNRLTNFNFAPELWFDLPPAWTEQIEAVKSSLSQGLQTMISRLSSTGLELATNVTKGVPGFLVGLVFTVLSSFFISFQYDRVRQFLSCQLPEPIVTLIREIREILNDTVGRYLRGYFKIMSVTFIELSIAFTILGVDRSILVALGVSLFDILPVFGTGGIVVPWIIVELLTGDVYQALGLLITYGIVTVVRNFIEPKIIGDQLGLNPVVSVASIYLGYRLFGVFGMILMPIAVQIVISLHKKGICKIYQDLPNS